MARLVVPTALGEDEALRGLEPIPETHELVKQLKAEIKDNTIKAKFKLEVQFGQNRSISALKPSIGVIVIWESGKKFHGGGDEQMFWCGYPDCYKPMSSANFATYHVVCPSCHRECFLDEQSKSMHIQLAREDNKDVGPFQAMPLVFSERFFKLPPARLAELLEQIWRTLECNADVYLKYHPSDIRYKAMTSVSQSSKQLERARRLRGLHIYPLDRILKDTAAGGSVRTKFLGFITA